MGKKKLFCTFGVLALMSIGGCQLMPGQQEQQQAKTAQEVAEQATQAKIERLAKGIDADLKALRLTTPKDENALQKWQALKQLAPEHPYVEQTPKKISQRYLWLTTRAIDKEDVGQAREYLNLAKQFTTDPQQAHDLEQSVEALAQRLAAEAQAAVAAQQAEPEPAEPPPEEAPTQAPPKTPDAASEQAQAPAQAQPEVKPEPLVVLDQNAIDARSMAIGLELDRISPKIVEAGSPVVIQAQSMRDYRWLHALLKTSLYLVDSDFKLNAESRIVDDQPATVMLKPS